MDKREIIGKLIAKLEADLSVLTQSALAAHDAAVNVESKAEDKYDTRGLEASYLAGAQSKRAMELQTSLNQFRHIDVKTFDDKTKIASTALIELDEDGQKTWCLMMPAGGGMTVEQDGVTVQCITPKSPLGEALLGTTVGDQVNLFLRGKMRCLDIVSVR